MRTAEHALSPEDLMAYLDGELQPDRAAAVQAHLARCDVCQQLAGELRGVSHDLASWQPGGPPETLTVPHAVQTEEQRRRWFSGRWSPGSALGLAGAVVVILAAGLAGERWAVARKAPAASAAPGASAELERLRPGAAEGAFGGQVPGNLADQSQREPSVGPASRIVRTAKVTIVAKDFDAIRPAIDRVLGDVGGFIGEIRVSDAVGSRSVTATLRVPAVRLADALRSLGALGRVTDERQSAEDVTEQVVDLEVRLVNSRNTERRLTEVLKNRTGRVADILEVEREIARVREEIERLDAQRLNLERRVTYATITLNVGEQRQATLDMGPQPVGTRIRNAFVDGLRQAYESVVGVTLLTLQVAPVLLLWAAVLWFPARAFLRTGGVRWRGHRHT